MNTSFSTDTGIRKKHPFLEEIVEDVYRYILHATRHPEMAKDIAIDVLSDLCKVRMLPWRRQSMNDVQAIRSAMRTVRSVASWHTEQAREAYISRIQSAQKGESGSRRKIGAIVDFINGLSRDESELLVLRKALGWEGERARGVLGTRRSDQSAMEHVMQRFAEHIRERSEFSDEDPEVSFMMLRSVELSAPDRENILEAVYARVRRRSVVLYRVVVASVCVAMVPVGFLSAIMAMHPSSLQGDIRLIAALQVTLSSEAAEANRRMEEMEESLKGISAYYQVQDLTKISMELASYALDEHMEMRDKSEKILHLFEGKEVGMKREEKQNMVALQD